MWVPTQRTWKPGEKQHPCLQQTGKSITKFEGCPIMFADGQFCRGDHRLWQIPTISYWRIL